MKPPPHISVRTVQLMPGVPLNVWAVRGDDFSVLIDTGVKEMTDSILKMCAELGNVGFVLMTHAHVDHMGASGAVRRATDARFVAGGAEEWFTDLDFHYREFCLPDTLGDPPGQRNEILGMVDGPTRIDMLAVEGTTLRLDERTELEVLHLPGHKLEELGLLDRSRRELFVADVLLALASPFFHGYQSARAFRTSLHRIEVLLQEGAVEKVYASHHPPMDAPRALEAVAQTRGLLDAVRAEVLALAQGITQQQLWLEVSERLDREPEFRGYAMIRAKVRELEEEGLLELVGGLIRRKQ